MASCCPWRQLPDIANQFGHVSGQKDNLRSRATKSPGSTRDSLLHFFCLTQVWTDLQYQARSCCRSLCWRALHSLVYFRACNTEMLQALYMYIYNIYVYIYTGQRAHLALKRYLELWGLLFCWAIVAEVVLSFKGTLTYCLIKHSSVQWGEWQSVSTPCWNETTSAWGWVNVTEYSRVKAADGCVLCWSWFASLAPACLTLQHSLQGLPLINIEKHSDSLLCEVPRGWTK